ncbi:MAG: polysaccharide deacetylase family protein [Flavobacterium sp.]|nr:MAG: polysaccharide deacetylase family protein [Flavobacterium sp.]
MKFYWIKTHRLIKRFFPGFVWDVHNITKTVYLTFDDGPTPEVTEWVLDELRKHDIKATFFCIGNNIENHPEIFKKVAAEGHAIGNHTFNHLNGWNTGHDTYIENTLAAAKSISNHHPDKSASGLFRPPYGKIKSGQAKALRALGYQIIMWDVLSADFDTTISPQQCLENVVKNTRKGSIIIFHDSVKASENLRYALPKAIEYLKENNFSFGKLD